MAKPQLTLEDYMNFLHFQDNQHNNFTISKLNQILYMHGLCKKGSDPKKKILDALSSIALQPLQRSTLGQDIVCSVAFLKLEEVKEDLAALDWQDCCVRSIQTLRSEGEKFSSADLNSICVEPPMNKRCRSPPRAIHKNKKYREEERKSAA